MEKLPLRNFGVFSESEYKGKTLQEATKYAEDGGFVVRIVEEDGDVKMLDMSVRADRLNFRVRGGFVTATFGG
jgi:hypothetical protein